MTLIPSEEDLLSEIDEGFGDVDEELAYPDVSCDDITVTLPSDGSASEVEVSWWSSNDSLKPRITCKPGLHRAT